MDTFLPNLPDGLTADTRSQSSHNNSDVDVGWDGDDESDGLGTGDHNSSRNVRDFVINEIKNMYAHRYEMPRRRLPCGPPYLHHVTVLVTMGMLPAFSQSLIGLVSVRVALPSCQLLSQSLAFSSPFLSLSGISAFSVYLV